MTDSEIFSNWTKLKNLDPRCFACGTENKNGLNMVFETDGSKLRSHVIVPEYMRGWSNLVHGGIISTMVDEAMSWTAIHLLKRLILTKNMFVEFKRPIRIESPLTVYGFVIDQKHEKTATMAAEIFDTEGNLCATGKGEFALFTIEQFAKLGAVSNDDLNDIALATKNNL